jgi:hypothetical protein
MPSPSEVRQYRSQNHPADDTSPSGGGISSIEITGAVPHEVVPAGGLVVGLTTKTLYYKTFVKNTGADSATSVRLYLLNGLADMASPGTVRLTAAAGDAGKVARIVGLVGTSVVTENVTLTAGDIVSTNSYDNLIRVELTGASPAAGDVTIRRHGDGAYLGKIPAGYYLATAEVDVGAAATVNDTHQTTNRLTGPSGITFSRPNTLAGALALPDLGAGQAIGVWRRYTLRPGTPPTTRLQVVYQVEWVSA